MKILVVLRTALLLWRHLNEETNIVNGTENLFINSDRLEADQLGVRINPSSVREEDFKPRPPDYKSRALTTTPRRLLNIITPSSTPYSCTSIDKNIIYLVVAESVSVHWAAVRVLRQYREYTRN